MDLASSTVITPSLPTFSIASAIRSPMVLSLLAEMVPTWEISVLFWQGLLSFFNSPITTSTALSIPRLISIGFAPAVMFFAPSRIDGLRQHRRCRGSVTRRVAGLAGDFADELSTHVLVRILELDFLGDGHAVLGDGRGAELFVENGVAALRVRALL